MREDAHVDLTEFLLARIAEDEAVAQAASSGPWGFDPRDEDLGEDGTVWCAESHPDSIKNGMQYASTYVAQTSYDGQSWSVHNSNADGEHIARWDPARVLAECEAKRRIVVDLHRPVTDGEGDWFCDMLETGAESNWPCETIRLLALPYADHSDYREEWRP